MARQAMHDDAEQQAADLQHRYATCVKVRESQRQRQAETETKTGTGTEKETNRGRASERTRREGVSVGVSGWVGGWGAKEEHRKASGGGMI